MPGAAEAVPGGPLWPGSHPGAGGRLQAAETNFSACIFAACSDGETHLMNQVKATELLDCA